MISFAIYQSFQRVCRKSPRDDFFTIFRSPFTPPIHEIVDCGAIYEVTFLYISYKMLVGDFSYRLNIQNNWPALFFARGRLIIRLGVAVSRRNYDFQCTGGHIIREHDDGVTLVEFLHFID